MKWKTSDLRKNWGIFRLVNDDLLHEIRLFHIFPVCDGYMTSSLSVIFVTQFNDVYALGRDRCSMLGVCNKPALKGPLLIDELEDVNIQAIDTGLMHTLALTDQGKVYQWGLDVNKPYSYPIETIQCPTECTWLGAYRVLQIACGSYFNLALTDTYTVMYWGYYDITQSTPLRRPISFRDELSIVSLSSGLLFSAAVGSSGKVYTWTGPKREKWTCSPAMSTYDVITKVSDVPLGRVMTKKERPLEPRLVSFPEKLTGSALKVICTMRSLYILMDTGHIFVTGYVNNSFKLAGTDDKPAGPDKRSFCQSLLTISCAGYPVDIAGSKWNDALVTECINPENFFIFDDRQGLVKAENIAQAFTDSPTPQMRSTYVVDQDLDEPVYVSPRLELNKELFGSESLSDVKFQLANKVEVPAHKYVLLSYSQHFRNMYGGNWKETKSDVIDVSKYNPVAYKAFLKFLYTGVLDTLEVVELLELYHLADEYLEAALKKLCLREITKCNIDSSTVAELYDWALCNELTAFARKCVQYGASHLQDVLKSDGFANMAGERREVFVKELFSCDRQKKAHTIAF